MKEYNLTAPDTKLILQENILAVLSNNPLETVSSAIHNGGSLKTQAILNVEVPKGYGDKTLHADPEALLAESSQKLGLNQEFVGMITAAAVENFALVSKRDNEWGVSVMATAADNLGNTCSHSESAGEPIKVEVIEGTINLIVLIDGNPTQSCMVSLIITATEAKSAALRELDIRSRYSGAEATGTITDAIVVAKTGSGAEVIYGGPASKLGQLVGSCVRQAVKEAVMEGNECAPCRPIKQRLRERHLPVKRLASELAKVKSLNTDKATLETALSIAIGDKPVFAALLLAAAKLNEDFEAGLVSPQLRELDALGKKLGELLFKQGEADFTVEQAELAAVDLPPFLKQVLVGLAKKALAWAATENV